MTGESRDFGGLPLEALQELCHAGMGRASLALSELTGERISLASPAVYLLPPAQASRLFDGQEELAASVLIRIVKGIEGGILVLLTEESVLALIHLLTEREVGQVSALAEGDRSAIQEVGNILASSYLTALGDRLGLILLPSPPELFLDRAASAMEAFLRGMVLPEKILLVEACFEVDRVGVQGRFFLVADASWVKA